MAKKDKIESIKNDTGESSFSTKPPTVISNIIELVEPEIVSICIGREAISFRRGVKVRVSTYIAKHLLEGKNQSWKFKKG